MEKVLNQEEIDALVRTARGEAGAAGKKSEVVLARWDIRRAGQIDRAQARALGILHEGFARNLTHTLGAHLRVAFQVALVAVEHLTYSEFLQGIPEITYLSSCKVGQAGASALMQMDLSVAFALIDVLLGGEGTGMPPARAVTTIEAQVLETIMRMVCRELQIAWEVLAIEFQFDQKQDVDQAPYLMGGAEKILALSFEITMADCRGTLSIAVPAVVSNPLLRKISAVRAQTKLQGRPEDQRKLRARLLGCAFQSELTTIPMAVPALDLIALSPGSLLMLRQSAAQLALLKIGGHDMFHAKVARRGEMRAAQLGERCAEAAPGAAFIALNAAERDAKQ